MRDFDFLSPTAAYLLLIALFLIFAQLYLYLFRKKQTKRFADPLLMKNLLRSRSRWMTFLKMGLLFSTWIFAVFALMQPEGNFRYISTINETNKMRGESIFLIDISGSMTVPDGLNGVTRFNQAKQLIDDSIEQIDNSSVALYAFSSELQTIVPATFDYSFFSMMLANLGIDENGMGGTDFEKVLSQLNEQLKNNQSSHLSTIFLFSDGGDNKLYDDKQGSIESITNALPDPSEVNYKLYTIGMGSEKASVIPNVTNAGQPVSSQLEPGLLIALAKKGGGEYFTANQWKIKELATQLAHQIQMDLENSSKQIQSIKKEDQRSDLYFQIPLLIALLSLMTFLVLPDVKKDD